jgi:hypothetical protein
LLCGLQHHDDFGTSMPFKSPGGVHLIICGAKDASRHFLYRAATPPRIGEEGNFARNRWATRLEKKGE